MRKIPSEFPQERPSAKSFIGGFRAVQGHATATIYWTSTNGYDEFKIPYKDDGKRRFHRFSGYEDARDKGNEMLEQVVGGDAHAITLKERDKVIYLQALELLRPLGVRLDTAVGQFVESAKALEGCKLDGHKVTPAQASRAYAKRYPANMPDKTVAEVVAEFIQAKEAEKCSTRYLEDLRYRLGLPIDKPGRQRKRGLAMAFQAISIARVEAAELRAFLDGLNLSPRSYNNFRCTIISLFEFAKSRKYLPSDWNEFDGINEIKDNGGDIEVFTPEEIEKLLKHVKATKGETKNLLPFLAIGAFAGLRSAEIDRLDWSEIKFDSGFIEVGKDKAKTRARRLVPMTDNLKAWLHPFAKAHGKVWPHGHTYLYELLQATAKAAKVAWKQNALRHSYISYRVADAGDVDKIARDAGNSPAMIFSNYRELVTPEQAKLWFAVLPKQEEKPKKKREKNVITFPTRAKAAQVAQATA